MHKCWHWVHALQAVAGLVYHIQSKHAETSRIRETDKQGARILILINSKVNAYKTCDISV